MAYLHDREVSAEQRSHILYMSCFGPVGFTALLWIAFISVAIFNFDIVRFIKGRFRRADPSEVNLLLLYFVMAMISTVVGSAVAAFRIRRAFHLARNGIEVVAEARGKGWLSAQGMVKLKYQYTVDGRVYRKAMSCPRDTAKEYLDGSEPLVLLCDPQHPRRVMLKSDVVEPPCVES